MGRRFLTSSLALLACAVFIAATAAQSHAQNLARYASEFLLFDGTELHAGPGDTPAIDNGVPIFSDHVQVPASANVLYVTLSATGDTSNTSTESQFTCIVDGTPCNAGATFDATAAGWIVLEEGTGDQDDNSINYTWCTRISPLSSAKGKDKLLHDVQLRIASNGAGTASIEAIHVFVDGNKVKNAAQACAEGHS
ncbi:MAG TPA: hypothetical protein VNF27_04230 [Candidatus Binataceae bacterium]|nr:hypothetical protein [Candidatus Binataceae bacterium]